MAPSTPSSLCLLLCTLAAVGAPASASAMVPDTACLPEVQGHGPQWWKPSSVPEDVAAQFDDGAGAKADASGRLARTRLLWDPKRDRVLVRVEVTGDESIEPADDRFILALGDDTGTLPELYIGFRPLLDCADPSACEGGVPLAADAIEYSEATVVTSVTWSALSSVDPSASFDVVHPWIDVFVDDSGPVTTYDWTLTFALEVPVDPSGDIRADLRAYGSVVDHVPGPTSATEIELPMLCTPSSSTSNDCLIYGGGMEQLPLDLPTAVADTWTELSSSCTMP